MLLLLDAHVKNLRSCSLAEETPPKDGAVLSCSACKFHCYICCIAWANTSSRFASAILNAQVTSAEEAAQSDEEDQSVEQSEAQGEESGRMLAP
jgi:hypothetical protein